MVPSSKVTHWKIPSLATLFVSATVSTISSVSIYTSRASVCVQVCACVCVCVLNVHAHTWSIFIHTYFYFLRISYMCTTHCDYVYPSHMSSLLFLDRMIMYILYVILSFACSAPYLGLIYLGEFFWITTWFFSFFFFFLVTLYFAVDQDRL